MFQNETLWDICAIIGAMHGFVVATSQRRRAMWERVFGSDRVPVLDVCPRWVEFRDGPALGFDVAVGALHEGQLNRLAAYVGRVNRVDYGTARRMVAGGFVVRADGLVVETADAVERRPFGFGRFGWLDGPAGRVRSLGVLRSL